MTQLRGLEGIQYIYTENIYIYCFLAVLLITAAVMLIRGPKAWKKRRPQDAYAGK